MTSIKRYPDPWGPPHPVYIAEKAALPFGEPFYNLDHAVEYATNLLSQDWWPKAYPKIHWIWIYESDGKKFAWAGANQDLHLPPFAMNESYFLHELAHLACFSLFPNGLDHGPEFRTVFCHILRNTMGDWVADNMAYWYDRMGVPVDDELMKSLG